VYVLVCVCVCVCVCVLVRESVCVCVCVCLSGQLAGERRGFPLKVLWCGNMVSCHQVLIRSGRNHTLALHLGLGHVIIARVKVFLLESKRKFSWHH